MELFDYFRHLHGGMNMQGCGNIKDLVDNYANWPKSIMIICRGKLLD